MVPSLQGRQESPPPLTLSLERETTMAYHPHHLGLRGLGQSKPGVDNTGRDAAQVVSTIGSALPGIVGLFTGQQPAAPATTPLVPMVALVSPSSTMPFPTAPAG